MSVQGAYIREERFALLEDLFVRSESLSVERTENSDASECYQGSYFI